MAAENEFSLHFVLVKNIPAAYSIHMNRLISPWMDSLECMGLKNVDIAHGLDIESLKISQHQIFWTLSVSIIYTVLIAVTQFSLSKLLIAFWISAAAHSTGIALW